MPSCLCKEGRNLKFIDIAIFDRSGYQTLEIHASKPSVLNIVLFSIKSHSINIQFFTTVS